ncbi:acyl-CoA dehydrogenase family protein [Dactylosporangium matsuzakiense]|uniref:Acyl-CoA dehydrogenase n=1 Tax=Dactylosporangium matsuzakiense TaxID=53360 RepID=A0A9W6KE81_9ACTN|nr:acyl-CoA dehydrogenase family protein [Dactylosporangium matsuzakiense]UWZ47136.1 acyl-CoA dehydrogenase family protein [Dactylosporangium matsuzakiense]GLK98429.1 acyl-CoA dehydrogenase [Dactylosporangium matsuzakiense]
MTTPTTHESVAAEAHAFFAARAPKRERRGMLHGVGDDDVVGVGLTQPEDEAAEVAEAQRWQRELFDAGLAWLDGPPALGGRGLGPDYVELVAGIAAEYELPSTGTYMVSHGIVAPTILAHGTEEQQRAFLPGIWRGDLICCQLFSEPEAGSDLASLRTTAVRDGDDWIVTGQKVWSSFAHVAKLGELLVRTGPPESRHRGLSMFLIDMDSPGIDVRPLRQVTGSEHFNEVFLDGVRVPDARRLGPVDGGWNIAMTTVGSERSVLGRAHNGIMIEPVIRLFALARSTGAIEDPAIQDLLAECWAREQVLHETATRLRDAGGPAPGSVVKLMTTSDMEYYSDVAARLLGYRMVADTGAWGTYSWSQLLLSAPSHRIAGGSDEIQRNILAERVLGLPREERPVSEKSA